MKKKVIGLILILAICFGLTGCVEGERIENSYKIEYSILLNEGSCFVYTFKDEETGVWYIATSKGVTPRLNADGTLYVSE